jgi:hypothetical protein
VRGEEILSFGPEVQCGINDSGCRIAGSPSH